MTTLTIDRGDTEYLDLTVTGLTAEQLAAATLTFTAKQAHHSTTPTIEKTSADGITVDELVATVQIDPADTEDLADRPVHLVYDLQSVTSGQVDTLVKGTLIVRPDVSS